MTHLPTTFPHLLPGNATPLERAFSGATGRLAAIPYPIREAFRWDTCPAPLLPWLAWEMSVDLWDEDWPEQRKRSIIRESFELHRRKGTLYAIERYCSYADAPLRRAIVPPDKAFAGASMTAEERAAWLIRFPQLRIYRFRNRGEATMGAFTSSGLRLNKLFLGDEAGNGAFFPYVTDAIERIGRRAYFWDKGPHYLASGEETPLKWFERTRTERGETYYDHEQLLIPGSKVQALFPGQVVGNYDRKSGRMFPVASVAGTRIITVNVQRSTVTAQDVLSQKTVAPSLTPIQAFPDQVAERGVANLQVQMFCGMRGLYQDPATRQRHVVKSFVGGYLPETSAGERLYDRLHYHDPARLPEGRPRAIYAGHFRLGMPPYHAELMVEARGSRSRRHFGAFVYGYLKQPDLSHLRLARTAVVLSKAHRDKILLRTALHRSITSRDRIFANTGHRAGGLVSLLN